MDGQLALLSHQCYYHITHRQRPPEPRFPEQTLSMPKSPKPTAKRPASTKKARTTTRKASKKPTVQKARSATKTLPPKHNASQKPSTRKSTTQDAKHQSTGGKPSAAAVVKHTLDEDRGGQFFSKFTLWKILHEDGGQTVFSKETLAERLFGTTSPPNILPEEEASHASRVEAKRREAQRLLLALQAVGVGVINTNEIGEELSDDESDSLARRRKKRYWKYDPHHYWSVQFDDLINKNGFTPYEFAALATLSDMLDSIRGTPQLKAVEKLLDKIRNSIPPELVDDAREIGRIYRCSHSMQSKYQTAAHDLSILYHACLNQSQVEFEYNTPGVGVKARRIAPETPVFDREDSALYIVGHEYDIYKQTWSDIKQFKVDRITLRSTKALKLKNPSPSHYPTHDRVRFLGPADAPARLDREHLYYESAGAYFETHRPAVSVEVLIRPPKETRLREAANWMCWVEEKPFHRNQETIREKNSAGHEQLRLRIPACNENEIASRLLRMGDCFEIIAPDSLRERITGMAKGILAMHDLE